MIEIKKLNKSFGEKMILKNFNETIEDGIMLAVVGKSGSGKSTLLNMIGLLDLEYDGEILYDSHCMKQEKESKRIAYIRNHINYLFQNYALVENETVEYNLLLALEYEKISKKEKLVRIQKVLEEVDMAGSILKKVYTLSGGEQQRIALARIMLKKGNLVLADEPTGNLDEENSKKVMEILKKLQKSGKTIIIVTHDETLARGCDRIIRLS